MSETMRGGRSGDGDAVAEADADADAELVLETGAGLLLFWVVFVVLLLLVSVRLSASPPSAVASPVLATEDGAGAAAAAAADGGSSTSAEAISPAIALTADSMGWDNLQMQLGWKPEKAGRTGFAAILHPLKKRSHSGLAQAGFYTCNPSKRLNAWAWYLSGLHPNPGVLCVLSKVSKRLVPRRWRKPWMRRRRRGDGWVTEKGDAVQMQCESARQDTDESSAQTTREATAQPDGQQGECSLCQMDSWLKFRRSQSQKSRLEAGRQGPVPVSVPVQMGSRNGQQSRATRQRDKRNDARG